MSPHFFAGKSPPDFVKIDAESSEIEVLRGMEGILHRGSPVLVVELGDVDGVLGPATSSEIVQYLENLGYESFEIWDGFPRRHSRQERYRYCQMAFMKANPQGTSEALRREERSGSRLPSSIASAARCTSS